MTDIISQAINTLKTLHERSGDYDATSSRNRKLQGDFYTHVNACDTEIEGAVVKLLDAILCSHASYYLYENGTAVEHADGKVYPLKTLRQIKRYARQFSPYGKGDK